MANARSRIAHDRLFDTLESRQLLAAPPAVTFTGVDGDGEAYTVLLRGGGNMVVTAIDGGGIDTIVLSNTTANSSLVITVRKFPTTDGAVSVNSITSDADLPLKSLSGPINLAGSGIEFFASIGAIRLRDVVNGADITTGGSSSDSVDFSARFISNTNTGGTSEFTFAGRLASFRAATVFFVTISAPSAGTFLINGLSAVNVPGNADAFSLNLTDANATRSIDKFTITGNMGGGAWVLASGVREIRVGSSGGDWTTDIAGNVGKFFASHDAGGELSALSFTTVDVRGLLAGSLVSTLDDGFGLGFRTVRVNVISGGSIDAESAVINSITTRHWNGGGMSALRLNRLNITGGGQLNGDLISVAFSFAGLYDDNTVGSIFVNGRVTGSTIRVAGDVGTVDIGGANNFRFFAGVNSSVQNFPSSITDFALTGGVVKAFRVHGNFARNIFGDLLNRVTNIQVAARIIQRIDFYAPILFDNNGTAFGVVSDSIGAISYRTNGDLTRSLNNLSQPGTGQSLNEGDFQVRVV